MRPYLLLPFIFAFLCAPLTAQTVIDLQPGGGIRAKDLNDSDLPALNPERIRRDSLKYRDLLPRAFNALSTDSLEMAEQHFREALKLRPKAVGNEIVRHNLGLTELALGKFPQAAETFGEVLKTQPGHHEARRMRALANSELARHKEVLADCEALLRAGTSGSSHTEVLFLRAGAYMGLRRYVDARADLEEILRSEPRNDNAALMIALCYDGERRTNEALERINLLLQKNPDFLEAILARADLEYRSGADLAARADYDAAIRLRPGRARTYAERAKVLSRLGMKHLARQDVKRAEALGMSRAELRQILQKK